MQEINPYNYGLQVYFSEVFVVYVLLFLPRVPKLCSTVCNYFLTIVYYLQYHRQILHLPKNIKIKIYYYYFTNYNIKITFKSKENNKVTLKKEINDV